MHVNIHALPYVNSILPQHPVYQGADFFSNLPSVTYVLCNEIRTNHTKHELSGMIYVHDVVSRRIMPQQLQNLTNTPTEPSRSHALTICSGSIWSISTFCFATAIWTLAATSFSSGLQACSRAWHPWGLTCVVECIENVCVHICVWRSGKSDISKEGQTIIHVNRHALPSVNSILPQHPVCQGADFFPICRLWRMCCVMKYVPTTQSMNWVVWYTCTMWCLGE
jgi:hypothetical protein